MERNFEVMAFTKNYNNLYGVSLNRLSEEEAINIFNALKDSPIYVEVRVLNGQHKMVMIKKCED